jgi:hypothetical protein
MNDITRHKLGRMGITFRGFYPALSLTLSLRERGRQKTTNKFYTLVPHSGVVVWVMQQVNDTVWETIV